MLQHPRILDRPHLVRVESAGIAAGNNLTWMPPARQHVEIISIQVELTTDATAIDRRMMGVVGGVADDDAALACQVIQPASQVWNYWFLRGLGNTLNASAQDFYMIPLPLGLVFAAPAQFRTDIIDLQAGDQITAYRIRYMMWQDPAFLT